MDQSTKAKVEAALWRAFEQMAGDLQAARADAGDTGGIPRDEAMEVTLDRCHGGFKGVMAQVDPEVEAAWKSCPEDERERIALRVFRHREYV